MLHPTRDLAKDPAHSRLGCCEDLAQAEVAAHGRGEELVEGVEEIDAGFFDGEARGEGAVEIRNIVRRKSASSVCGLLGRQVHRADRRNRRKIRVRRALVQRVRGAAVQDQPDLVLLLADEEGADATTLLEAPRDKLRPLQHSYEVPAGGPGAGEVRVPRGTNLAVALDQLGRRPEGVASWFVEVLGGRRSHEFARITGHKVTFRDPELRNVVGGDGQDVGEIAAVGASQELAKGSFKIVAQLRRRKAATEDAAPEVREHRVDGRGDPALGRVSARPRGR